MALLIASNCSQKVDFAKCRPVDIREIKLAISALPEQETRKADFTARADDEVRVRQIRCVKVAADLFLRDFVHDVLESLALFSFVLEEGP